MNRNKSKDERPSIIQEIVFYDKPNIKTVVPGEILPESTKIPLGKGDIVYSRIRTSLSHTSLQKERDKQSNFSGTSDQEFERCKGSSSQNVEEQLVLNEIFVSEGDIVESSSGDALNEEVPRPHDSLDSLNHFVKYEHLGEDIDLTQGSFGSNKGSGKTGLTIKITNKDSQSGKNIEGPAQSPKKVTKSPKQQIKESSIKEKKTLIESSQSKKTKEKSGKFTKEAPAKESPFKTPKGRAKKAEKKTQKVTMLNYVIKKSKDVEQGPSNQKILGIKEVIEKKGSTSKEIVIKKSVKEKTLKRTVRKSYLVTESPKKVVNAKIKSFEKRTENNKSSSSQMSKTGSSRSRGRPRKSAGGGGQAVRTENYSDKNVSCKSPKKNKNYTELTNVPMNDTDNSIVIGPEDLEEILNETQEQVKTLNRVQEELQSVCKNGEGEEGKHSMRGTRRVSRRKPKPPVLVEKVKNEDEEVLEDEESNRDPLDVSMNDDDTDGDSRSEWVPSEYAEYKQQHLMRNQNKKYPCKYCGKHFTSYYGMRKHRALEHNDVGKDRKEGTYKESLKCKQEKEQVESDEESRGEWMPQEYADYKMKHKMNKMKRVQWYKCKICCAVFSNYYKLSKHRIEHESKPNPYECKQCDSRFKDVETLMAHIRVHQGKDPYQCKKCEKGFMTRAELDEHIPVHILKKGPVPVKRFRCDICSKEFSKLCDIERHTRVHTGEKPSECNICHKRFQQSHNLSKHLLTHLHVKPFQCEICNKKFGRVDVLNRHLLTHSMEKPFKCEICNKGFIRQVQLMNHVEKMHTSSDRGLITLMKGDDEDDVPEDNGREAMLEDDPNEVVIDQSEEPEEFEESGEQELCEEVVGI